MWEVVLFWIICAIIAVGAAVWVWQRDRHAKHKLKWLPTVLRGLSFFIVAMLLLAPALSIRNNHTQKPIVVWLQDNSSSIADGLKADIELYNQKQSALYDKLDDQYELVKLNFGPGIENADNGSYNASVTNIEQALVQVYQRYKGSNLGAVVLSSDGIYNEGADPSFTAQAFQVPIYSIALGDSSQVKDIGILRVLANKVVMVGNTFEVATDVRFSKFKGSQHTVRLSVNGSTVQQQQISVDTDDEVRSLGFELMAKSPGLYKYSIEVSDGGAERTLLNNTLDFYVQVVSNDVKVAIINGGTHSDIGYIKNALQSEAGYAIDVLEPNTLPNNLATYNLIIAHQPNISPAQWKTIQDAKLPVWHILGNLTSGTQTKFLESYIKVAGGRPSSLHTPILQKRFGGFLLPVNAANVLAKLPPLESNIYGANSLNPNAVVLQNKQQQADMWMIIEGQPNVAITIGEGIWRWGMYEYKDNRNQIVSQEIIRQTMRILHVPKQDKPFQVFLNKRMLTDNENVAFTAELRNASGQLVNDAIAQLIIADSNGTKKTYEFEKVSNSYNLILPKLGAGKYTYKGTVQYKGVHHHDMGDFVVESVPLELLNTQANFGLMYQLAQQSNGKFYTIQDMDKLADEIVNNAAIKPIIVSEEKHDPFINYRWLFFVILGLLTFEWLFRKYNNM